ncbi:hypothetical protein IEE94_09075 [Yimella sp. cx-573]|nr:hypothetical protein [Yimella sp. cx-573]
MTWLTLQTIACCLVGFCVGALAAWLLAMMLFPHENDPVQEATPAAEPDAVADDAEPIDARPESAGDTS